MLDELVSVLAKEETIETEKKILKALTKHNPLLDGQNVNILIEGNQKHDLVGTAKNKNIEIALSNSEKTLPKSDKV